MRGNKSKPIGKGSIDLLTGSRFLKWQQSMICGLNIIGRRMRRNNAIRAKSAILLVIPLLLSAFIHLWNPIGFPGIHGDEGHYIRRGIHVSEGLGPQESTSTYDHPYFGWIFLGSIFSIGDYPDSLNAKAGDVSSIKAVWEFPRLIVGLFALIDTFLIYKIAERRYSTKIAFIAAVLFAVMPFSWMARRVLLESLQLPLLLSSVLFAVFLGGTRTSVKTGNYKPLLALLSGIFLGLAIFAKIPGFAFIPLVGYLVFTHSNRSVKSIALFLAPVILVPLIWPAYAFSANEYDKWLDGIDFQTSRASKPLSESIDSFFSTDPILLLLGVAGTIFAAVIKKDIIFVLWILPFVIFLYLIDYVSSFFLIPLLPPLCIAAAVMIVDMCSRIAQKKRRLHSLLPYGVIAAIGIYGLSITTPLLNQSENVNYFEVISAVSDTLPVNDTTTSVTMDTQPPDGKMTVIGSPSYYWMLQYVFDKPQYNYKTQYNLISKSTLENILDQSEKVILIADGSIMKVINKETDLDSPKAVLRADRLILIYNNTKVSDIVDEVQIRTNF
jgi:hypothetical protein